MTDQEILTRLADAIENSTPDILNDILLQCDGNVQNTDSAPPNKTKTKRIWLRWASGIAATLIIVFGIYFGYQNFSVDSIIGIDVNPGIELKTNQREKIISVTAINQEAEAILDGMDLQGIDLDIAVNALIGSMLKNGYVDELKNSILISVENADSGKSAALQERLSAETSKLLEAYSINAAVLSQTVSDDERIKALAAEHNISIGKAVLVDLIVSQDNRYSFAEIAMLSINDINLLISSKETDLQGITSNGKASSQAYISEEEVKNIVCSHAQIPVDSTTFKKIEMDWEHEKMVFEVKAYYNGSEYEYEIDASTGDIIEYEHDGENTNKSSYTNNKQSENTTNTIGEASAKLIAFNHAQVSESSVSKLKIELDHEDDILVYDIEFKVNDSKFEYTINATSGAIIEWDADYDD